ncbi:N-acetylneuraminate synthase family protein [Pontibacter sp. JAM-7]|uniref:N-acetylneuraminate synthase family protein n=1 Tax=Pontibacter sp. JAM-7 TaxID=3366581 RepID=UPI003AF50E3D
MQEIKIIAEIGINHNGEYECAYDLIKASSDAGVWGVKFQYRNLSNAYVEGASEIGDEMIFEEIKRNYLSPSVIIKLTEAAHKLGLKVGISFFDVTDLVDFNGQMADFDFFKVPSAELCNVELVNTLLSYDSHVYVSLGCHDEIQIDKAFAGYKYDNWTAMHCVSNYPVSLSNAKLGYLKHMANKWDKDFGYSSHDENWELCLIAMSLGASVIERHITLDKNASGLDHTTSSTPEEFEKLVSIAKYYPFIISGNADRVPNQGEFLNLQNLGRSYYAKEEISAGEPITLERLEFRSPRVGLSQQEVNEVIGAESKKTLKIGDVINKSVFKGDVVVSDKALDYAKRNKVALPVRLHDIESISGRFPTGAYEFHLSFGEVLSDLRSKKYDKNNIYSIHLPDYISPTELIDPFSNDSSIRERSNELIDRTVDFASHLQEITGNNVPVVGSFSLVGGDKDRFYENYTQLFAKIRNLEVDVLPQWLPPIAWYFGGSVDLHVFNAQYDIDKILEYKLPICMDVCHLCMGKEVFGFDPVEVIEKLQPLIKHIHIADAQGIDGEGLNFGDGDPDNLVAIKSVLDFECMKVIEVWQGHLDNGAGFAEALNRLVDL